MDKKRKVGKLDFIKIKNFCDPKGSIKIVKRQPTEQEKIFANHIANKGLISIIYKELLQFNSKKKKKRDSLTKIWAKDLNRHFSKEDIQMANRHIK